MRTNPRIRLLIPVILLICGTALAQQTKTYNLDCWNGIYPNNSCTVCGSEPGGYNSNRYYSYGEPYPGEPWQPTCGYQDTLSSATVVTGVNAVMYMNNCTSIINDVVYPLTFNATLNGTNIATPITLWEADCSCGGTCLQAKFERGVTTGFPGYVAGGTNTFGIEVTAGVLALDRVDITVTYQSAETATVTSLEPFIPTGSTAVNKCVLYRGLLTATLKDGTTAVSGQTITFKSDRNAAATPDNFDQPGSPTNAAGQTEGAVQTRTTGVASISVANYQTPSPAAVSFDEATYQSVFNITTYYTPSEADFKGATTTNPCGLTGTFNKNFLKTVKLEGSGVSNSGSVIQYDVNTSCYVSAAGCPLTSSGACAVAGVTAAVDPDIIPMNSSFRITGAGDRVAQDRGGAISGYDVDDYVGVGSAAYAKKTIKRAVRLLQGDPSCTN
jgi:3D (Asp-Asp-Asp) domain-containing protein